MKNKYTWDFNKEAEIWYNDSFDTIEECIECAKKAVKEELDYEEPPTTVFIGENIPFIPTVDVDSMLDRINEMAGDECGEVGGDWDAYDYKKKDEMEELRKNVDAVVIAWLKKYGRYPGFSSIDNIKEYSLCDGARE